MKFFSRIVVILRFYVSFLPLLPPNVKLAIPFRGQKGHEGHLFSVILYYCGITLTFFVAHQARAAKDYHLVLLLI